MTPEELFEAIGQVTEERLRQSEQMESSVEIPGQKEKKAHGTAPEHVMTTMNRQKISGESRTGAAAEKNPDCHAEKERKDPDAHAGKKDPDDHTKKRGKDPDSHAGKKKDPDDRTGKKGMYPDRHIKEKGERSEEHSMQKTDEEQVIPLRKSIRWRRWGSLAACLCVLLLAAVVLPRTILREDAPKEYVQEVPEDYSQETAEAEQAVENTAENEEGQTLTGGDTAAEDTAVEEASAGDEKLSESSAKDSDAAAEASGDTVNTAGMTAEEEQEAVLQELAEERTQAEEMGQPSAAALPIDDAEAEVSEADASDDSTGEAAETDAETAGTDAETAEAEASETEEKTAASDAASEDSSATAENRETSGVAGQTEEDQETEKMTAAGEEAAAGGMGMDTGITIQWIILVLLMALSAFFSSAETALTTVNRIQAQLIAEEGKASAKRVLWILDRSDKMLSAILIGNNVVNLSASALATTLTIAVFGSVFVGIATGILTLVLLVFGEIVPKSLATIYSLRIAMAYSAVIKALMILLTPLIFLVDMIMKGILKLLRVDKDAAGNSMTERELKTLVDVGLEEGAIEDDEFEMITNVFRLDESLARDIMIPRTDMTYVQVDMTKEQLMGIYREDHYTRYPVYTDNRDTVIGIINMKDLLFLSEEEDFNIRKYMREPHFTFEHKEVGTLLIEMREESLAMTMVLDEYGAVSGLITMEDILEEIVGEIRDEYDKDETDAIRPLKKAGEYLIDGSTNLDDINEELDTDLHSELYDSLGGYIIEYLDRLPKKGEKILLENGIKLIVQVVKKNRIEVVHLILPGKVTENS